MGQIRVDLLFFALYRDMTGTAERSVNVPPGTVVAELVRIVRALPGCERLPAEPVVAVNQEYAALDTVIYDNDEVAFLPPVAGG